MGMEWIKVEDKLPEIEVSVLIFYTIGEHKYIEIAHINSITQYANQKSVEWIDNQYQPSTPTHWMPLPSPPSAQ